MKNIRHFRHGRVRCEAESMVCGYGTYVSVKNKGAGDLEAYMSRNKHKNAGRGGESSSKINIFFKQEGSAVGERIAATECTVTYHTLKQFFSNRSKGPR